MPKNQPKKAKPKSRPEVIINKKAFLLLLLLGFFLVHPAAASSSKELWLEPPAPLVLALFDSSEKASEKHNPIKDFLGGDLAWMGFQVVYYDIHKNLPPDQLMKRCRGIVTWFKDPKMRGAARYCQWLARQARSGKKLIILDNFGAYQEEKSSQWVSQELINQVFGQLGVAYRSNWNADPLNLQITHRDEKVIGTVSPPDLSTIQYYYFFKKLDPLVKEYLTVRRLDIPNSESAVIFSHPKGGMALSRYLFAKDPRSGWDVVNIDFKLFLEECFFGAPPPDTQRVLVVGETQGKGLELAQNVMKTLEYAKIDYMRVRLKDLNQFTTGDLRPYSSLVFCSADLESIKRGTARAIRRYVREGGGLLVARRAFHPKLGSLFGIRRKDSERDSSVQGLRLADSFFMAASSFFYTKDDIWSNVFRLVLHPKSRVLARALTTHPLYLEGVPLGWLHLYGRGRVFYWNGNLLYRKNLRALLLHSLLMTRPVAVYSFANVENIHVDDAPQPLYNIYRESVSSMMKLTDTEFCRGPWWADILELSKKYNFSLTFYTIFNYDRRTSPPFEGKEFLIGKENAFLEFVGDVIEHNFELGLHGYNHEPLILPGWGVKGWSKKAMRQALGAARDYWTAFLPHTEEPFSYVAPMNQIHREGKKALRETFPSIRVISALYSRHANKAITEQEFGPDPDGLEFFDIPRITAGYFFSTMVRNDFIDAVNSLGIWTHFIHPDDVFFDSRYAASEREEFKERDWAAMKTSFDSLFLFVRRNFPWLRDFSTKESYEELDRYFKDCRQVRIGKEDITIRFTSGTRAPKFFGVRINDGREAFGLEDCRLLYVDRGSGVFLFETSSSRASIRLEKGK